MGRCPPRERLADLLLGTLGGADATAVEVHVDGCPRCQAVLQDLSDADPLGALLEDRLRSPHKAPPLRVDFLCRLRTAELGPAAADASTLTLDHSRAGADERATPGPLPHVPGYEILAELGRGGVSVVYRARHLALGRVVALKMILAGAHAAPAERARLRVEAEAVAHLQHPNIVQIFEVGEEAGCPFLALECVEGGTLAVKTRTALKPAREAAALVGVLARAVEFAHQAGVIHRDLKPANVLLSPDGVPKIADFGLAKLADSVEFHTRTGTILGTPGYMAPEQAAGRSREIGPAADVYGLGAVLYDTLTGRPPFRGESPAEILQQAQFAEPVPPSRLRPHLSRDLETICLKCLEKDPRRRYPSARALADDLGRFVSGQSILARPTSAWERAAKWVRRQPALAAAAGVSVVAVLALVGSLFGLWLNAEDRARAVQQLDDANRQLADRQTVLTRLDETIKEQEAVAARTQVEVDRLNRALPEERARVRDARVQARGALYTRDMHLAQAALDKGEMGVLVRLLERHRPPPGEEDVRGPEWHCLWRMCHEERLVLHGHTGFPRNARILPDGKTVASAAGEGGLKLWDVWTGEERVLPQAEPNRVVGLAVSERGKALAAGRQDGAVDLWDLERDRYLGRLPAHAGPVMAVAFSPDGGQLATGGGDGRVRIWNWPEQTERATLLGHRGQVWNAEFTADGRTLVTNSADNSVRIWDLATGREPKTLPRIDQAQTTYFAISPDGRTLATADAYPFDTFLAGSVRLWRLPTGEQLDDPLDRPVGGCWGLRFSPDGLRLAVGHNAGVVTIWDLATRKVERRLLGHEGRVHSIGFSPDGRTVVTCANDKTVRVWDATPRSPAVITGPAQPAGQRFGPYVMFSPDGETMVAANDRAEVRLINRQMGKVRVLPASHGGAVHATAFLADSGPIATAGRDGAIHLWDSNTGERRATWPAHAGPVRSLAAAPNRRALASGGQDGTVKLWDPDTGKEIQSFRCSGHSGLASALAFSPDGTLLASGGNDFTVRLWDAATGEPRALMVAPFGGVMSVAFSPDGRLLAAGNYDGSVMLWNVADFKRFRAPDLAGAMVAAGMSPRTGGIAALAQAAGRFESASFTAKNPGHVFHLEFSRDGKSFLTSCGEEGVRFWDLSLRAVRFTLPGFKLWATVSSDGRYLATGDIDGSIAVWDLWTDRPPERAFVSEQSLHDQELPQHKLAALTAEVGGQGRRHDQ